VVLSAEGIMMKEDSRGLGIYILKGGVMDEAAGNEEIFHAGEEPDHSDSQIKMPFPMLDEIAPQSASPSRVTSQVAV